MFFLNLSLGEFLGLFAALSGVVTALYLLDRAKRKKVVSTLHFWTAASRAEEEQSRRRVRDPWSLILQLASLLLLLLAVAQLEWGSRERQGRDHVLLLDASSSMAQASSRGAKIPIMADAKALAERYVRSLPSRDRVLVARAGGLVTPVTQFTPDREQVLKAIRETTPSYTVLSLSEALHFAEQAQSWSGGQRGEIVYAGAARVDADEEVTGSVQNLRVLPVTASADDCGIRRLGVRRAEEATDTWDASVSVKNYGLRPQTLRVSLEYAATRFAPRSVTLEPGEERSLSYSFSTRAGGTLVATLAPGDALATDDRASLQLPKPGSLTVAVYTARPDVVRPLLEANHRLVTHFYRPDQYTPKPEADVMVLDEFAPAQFSKTDPPQIPALWINPPADHSPVPVKAHKTKPALTHWDDAALGVGLHAKAADLAEADVFQTFQGDLPVASTADGTVVVARPPTKSSPRLAVIGFDPLAGELRYELTTPLLFADLTRWLAPESFRTTEFTAITVGAVSVPLDSNETPDQIQVVDDKGFSVPFSVRSRALQLYVERPSVVRVTSFGRERVFSLTLPDIAEKAWQTPASTPSGVPNAVASLPSAFDLWQWLALLGLACLLAEWYLFGRRRRSVKKAPPRAGAPGSKVSSGAAGRAAKDMVTK
jgi:hypothetical protein